jgi:hypothetical protein
MGPSLRITGQRRGRRVDAPVIPYDVFVDSYVRSLRVVLRDPARTDLIVAATLSGHS